MAWAPGTQEEGSSTLRERDRPEPPIDLRRPTTFRERGGGSGIAWEMRGLEGDPESGVWSLSVLGKRFMNLCGARGPRRNSIPWRISPESSLECATHRTLPRIRSGWEAYSVSSTRVRGGIRWGKKIIAPLRLMSPVRPSKRDAATLPTRQETGSSIGNRWVTRRCNDPL